MIISDNVRNQMADDVLVAPIFSRGRAGPTRVRLPEREGGISHDSVIFCEEITCVDVSFLARGPLAGSVSAGTL
ncbi:MAG TPA: type II toxin-antitoxin system PemK/MazF family toxin, partial [Chloroflexota bacterium]|nr:type II toxin-antitoxin system PemK/MazF family toxin [Chloroflexota bacterium]